MNIREAVEAEFDETTAHNPEAWVKEIRNRGREVDLWLAVDMRAACQSFNLNRYKNDPEAAAAVINMRLAAKKLEATLAK